MARTAKNQRRDHVEQRRLGFYALLNVPAECQSIIGRKRFLKSLETRDEARAKRRAAPLVADWKSQIAAARDRIRGAETQDDAQWWWRNALRKAKTEDERRELRKRLDLMDWETRNTNALMAGEPIEELYIEGSGQAVETDEYLDKWLASMQVTDKTVRMRRSHIERLADKFPRLTDVTRKNVRGWITDLMVDVKPATIRRMLSDCRTYWLYLATIEEVVPENSEPFDKLGLRVPDAERMPWSAEDLLRLHEGATQLVGMPRKANDWGDPQLADCILLAMYSGARLGELVNLRVEDVAADHFKITKSKTESGVRIVPIHPKLQQTMARLLDQSTDGYVLSGIDGGDRADTMSKAFTRLRKAMGYTNGAQVFHSIRHTFVTHMERAGAELGTYQDIVGHKRSTMTGATYSGKSTLAMRQEALAKLVY